MLSLLRGGSFYRYQDIISLTGYLLLIITDNTGQTLDTNGVDCCMRNSSNLVPFDATLCDHRLRWFYPTSIYFKNWAIKIILHNGVDGICFVCSDCQVGNIWRIF